MKLVINLNLEFSVLKKILKNSEEISFIYQKEKITFIVNHGEIYFIRTYDAYINEEPLNTIAHTLPSNILSRLPTNKKGFDVLTILITNTGVEIILNTLSLQVSSKVFNMTFFNSLKTQLVKGKLLSKKWLLWAQQVLRVTGDTLVTLHKGYVALRGRHGLFIYFDETLDSSLSISFPSSLLKRVDLNEVNTIQLMSGSIRL